jgi:hypothetical protein
MASELGEKNKALVLRALRRGGRKAFCSRSAIHSQHTRELPAHGTAPTRV